MAWHDMAWHGMTWHGMTWHGTTIYWSTRRPHRISVGWLGRPSKLTCHEIAWHDVAWHDTTWLQMIDFVIKNRIMFRHVRTLFMIIANLSFVSITIHVVMCLSAVCQMSPVVSSLMHSKLQLSPVHLRFARGLFSGQNVAGILCLVFRTSSKITTYF